MWKSAHLLAFALLVPSTAARAGTLLVVDQRSELFRLDTLGHAVQDVGPVATPDGGRLSLADIAMSGDGTLYGVTASADAPELVSINPNSGQAAPVGQLNYPAAGGINSLTFNPLTGGLLGGALNGDLLALNSSTGQAARIGNLGLTDPRGHALGYRGDIAFSPDGQLYAVAVDPSHLRGPDTLLTVDPLSGKGQVVGGIGRIGAQVDAADFVDGRLLAPDVGGNLIEINPKTGVGQRVGVGPKLAFGATATSVTTSHETTRNLGPSAPTPLLVPLPNSSESSPLPPEPLPPEALSIPEPASLGFWLLASSAAGLAGRRRKRGHPRQSCNR